MPKFTFKFPILQTLATFCSSDETRYTICGVHIYLAPGESVRLEATDGRRCIRLDTEWKHDADKAVSIILPADVIHAITADDDHYVKSECVIADDYITLKFKHFSVSAKGVLGFCANSWTLALRSVLPMAATRFGSCPTISRTAGRSTCSVRDSRRRLCRCGQRSSLNEPPQTRRNHSRIPDRNDCIRLFPLS